MREFLGKEIKLLVDPPLNSTPVNNDTGDFSSTAPNNLTLGIRVMGGACNAYMSLILHCMHSKISHNVCCTDGISLVVLQNGFKI